MTDYANRADQQKRVVKEGEMIIQSFWFKETPSNKFSPVMEFVRKADHLTALEAAMKEKDEQIAAVILQRDEAEKGMTTLISINNALYEQMEALEYTTIQNGIIGAQKEQIAILTDKNKELRQRLHAHGDIQTDMEEREAEDE